MIQRYARTIGLIATSAGAGCFLFLISVGAGAEDSRAVSPPLQPAGRAVGTPVPLGLHSYEELKDRQRLTLNGFVLDEGHGVALELEQFDVFAPDAVIVAGAGASETALDRPQVALFHGQLVGDLTSRVFLSVSPYFVNGTIQTDEATYVISSGPCGSSYASVIYSLTGLAADAIDWRPFVCRTGELDGVIPGIAIEVDGADDRDGTRGGRSAPCRVALIAVETDWEFTGDLFAGDPDASSAYATSLIGAVSEIYTRDINTRLEISFLRVWSNSNDLWDEDNTLDQLYQFQDYWNIHMTDVERNAAHFLSGRPLGGGVAYYPGLCYPEYDYGLSANLNGFFPYPLQHNHDQNWDLFVVAHELGHNFGGPHTHDMNPPIDGCAWEDCSVCPNGTIMSYCHLCPGGMTNIRLEFHSRMIDEAILPHLADPDTVELCDLTVEEVSITDQPDDVVACEGGPASFAVTATGYPALSYQWRKDGVDIPGADQDSYAIASVTFADAGDYDVLVSNTCGSATSATATLTVCPPILGDVDHDCDVDLEDLATLLANYGVQSGASYEDGDLDGDGDVDLSDLAALLGHYGQAGC
ncbi:MAG: hypothetical protein KKI02_04045 [Planctomycetes bacterium]|nr:hypothetical protein [Planctomycetota bacterium]